MNSFDQQWLTARTAAEAGLAVDDIWVRFVSLGGAAEAVAVAAYLQGEILLDVLQRNLVSHAVNELLGSPATSAWPLPPAPGGSGDVLPVTSSRAPYLDGPWSPVPGDTDPHRPDAGRMVLGPLSWRDEAWPRLTIRLSSMFDPDKAGKRRLASLASTGLVRAGREERFDRLTRLAHHDFMAHAAVISFIEADHQFIKSMWNSQGEGTQGSQAPDIPREQSFCVHTIEDDRTLIIEDTTDDRRVSGYPLVTGEPHIRFYAGHPLTGPGGWRIGALCVVDTEPRAFTEEDQRRLRTLTAHVQAEILATMCT